METSQQQRGSAIRQFASALADADLAFDALDLIDSLWLAQFYESGEVACVEPEADSQTDSPPDAADVANRPNQSADNPAFNLFPPERQFSPEAPREEHADAAADRDETLQGRPLSVPAAPALRTRLDLARALRPLMRKVPSRQRFDLDEEATVTKIAETEVWMPVVRPRPERWLELDLVVEESKTTAIWERSIAELIHLAEYQGAFRAVRTWRLRAEKSAASAADGVAVKLFPRWLKQPASAVSPPQSSLSSRVNQRPRTPRELIDPTGRRLIWVVTDCTSSLWQQAALYEELMAWSRVQSVSIMQMFPERLWSRTALRNGHDVKLSALTPGVPSAQMVVDGLPRRLAQRGGADVAMLTVVTVESEMLAQWARVVAGAGDTQAVGRAFDLAFIRKQAAVRKKANSDSTASLPESRPVPVRTAAERVALFRATSSKPVRRLANLLAAVPVSLPVIDLLRDEFRGDFEEEVRQSHVAEVLLSGLLRRCDTGEGEACRYEFFGDGSTHKHERVRDILLGDASVAKTRQVLDVLSVSIGQKLGRSLNTFEALLQAIQEDNQASESMLIQAALPFASIGLEVLLRLGGEHAKLSRRIDLNARKAQEDLMVDDFPPLDDFEFTEVQLSSDDLFPSLFTETFTIRTLERQSQKTPNGKTLESFDFEVATLVATSKDWQVNRHWRSSRRFIEKLSSDAWTRWNNSIKLEMVDIPGGYFTMGSPKEEVERSKSESPQHEVFVKPFFMGRYPITQAEWSIVAAMPKIEQKLNPYPSRFEGDTLPVEQVSWYDAVEFCARLSSHTGRQYSLPTETQWEYACRAGTTTPFHFGRMITPEVANYNGIHTYSSGPKGVYRETTTPVGQLNNSNSYGLADMHGNVWEWCCDHWHDSYQNVANDGSAWLTSDRRSRRVLRGGSWIYNPRYCRSAYRNNYPPDIRVTTIGFRVICVATS